MGHSQRLSVIVPTHGRVDLFSKTLASIEAQTCDDFELIVTDDSAKPEDQQAIEAAVDQYRESTGRAAEYVFTSPRLGQAANTNQGMFAATRSVLRILHSDDLVRPGCFQWEIDQFERFPEISLLFQDCLPFHEEDEIRWIESPTLRLVEPADYFRQFLSIGTALPSGMLFTKEAFDGVGGMREDWSFLCDWEFFANLLLRSVRQREFAGYVTAGNYAWRLHDDSTTTTKWRQHYSEHAELMKQWRESLNEKDVDLFVSKADFDNFLLRGDLYRNKRLIQDVSQISSADFRASLPWFRSNLSASLQRKILRKAAPKVLKRQIRATLGTTKLKTGSTSNPSSPSEQDAITGDWVPDLVITALHGEPDSAPCRTNIVVPYDNSINLWPMRQNIAAAKKIRITNPNLNRFYQLTVSECLKYIQPDAEIEFVFHDNQHLTWFGLKAVINQVAAGRFELTYQSQNPREGTEKGFSKWSLRYRCLRADAPWHTEPMTGLTIGVLTLGDRMEELNELIDTARKHCDVPYEIVLISPHKIEAFDGHDDVRQIQFSERDDLGWITRKKNLICQDAAYSDIVVCHDRFAFTESFFAAFSNWGWAYGIAAVRLQLPDGKRALDWGVVRGENHSWCQGGLLNYRDYSRFSYVPGGVTLIRKSFWQQFPWCEDLYWNEHEDVELCRRIQRSGARISFFPGLMITSRDRWVDENPLIDFSDQQDL
ncbi:hypothetical protein CKO51_01580 [Rhodopirellula sp. SM50]|nr:glycosyltransferase [Rhodopirellula sp. SM50]PAY21295.1 hypothetical protein CKO51_01580 [Rhodopirellula sp. SM50]